MDSSLVVLGGAQEFVSLASDAADLKIPLVCTFQISSQNLYKDPKINLVVQDWKKNRIEKRIEKQNRKDQNLSRIATVNIVS